MKRNTLLLISLIIITSSCNKPSPAAPTDSFYPSIEDSVVISETSSNLESNDSESASMNSSDNNSTDEKETTGETIIVKKEIILDFEDVPANQSGSYVADNEYEVDDYTFFYSSIMQNSGKFDNNVIQMKKEVGYIQNIDALNAEIFITLMKNSFYDYSIGANVSATIVPTIYVGDTIDNLNVTLSPTLIEETDTTVTYKLEESKNYSYFKIVNESSYAQYLVNITFKAYFF